MNRRNAKINAFAVRQLNPGKTDRVLEIGFGGGATLSNLIGKAGFVAGLDRSRGMVARANSRFSEAIASGRAVFREGVVEAIPFGDSTFEKVMTVNTVYFWKSLDRCFDEIYRVLTPEGRVFVGLLPKEFMDRMGMPKDIFTPRTVNEIVAALKRKGFDDVRIERPEIHTAWVIISAYRPCSHIKN
jgi:SAM-dependent methyltransferase